MKRIVAPIALFTFLMIFLPIGCKPSTAPTPPLAPGYTSQADQTLGETLAAAHQFYMSIQQDVVKGTYTPTATEKQSLNTFAVALNVAQASYLAYHNGTGTLADAQAKTQIVSQQQAALTASITGAK